MTTQNDELDLVYNPNGKPLPRAVIPGVLYVATRISPLPDDGLGMLETLVKVFKMPRDISDRPRSTVTPMRTTEYFNRNILPRKNPLSVAIQSATDKQDKGDNHV